MFFHELLCVKDVVLSWKYGYFGRQQKSTFIKYWSFLRLSLNLHIWSVSITVGSISNQESNGSQEVVVDMTPGIAK